ncbi:MAG: PH domain-containing protein, partial [Acidimicrobiales bacterium]
ALAVAFPKKLLNEGEEIALDLRPHWWFLAEPVAALIGSVLLGLVVWSVTDDRDAAGWDILRFAAGILIVACLVWFGLRYLKWMTTNFVVTSDRVVFRSGVIAKRGIEIPLERINTVFFNQSIFERMIGAGDVAIESGGESGKESFSDIRKPSAVQNEIYRQMEVNNTRMYGGLRTAAPLTAPTTAPAPDVSIPEQIEKLDDLRKRGVISDQEFAAKKAELLERM